MRKAMRGLAFFLIFAGLVSSAPVAAGNADTGNSLYADWGDVGTKHRDAVLLISVHANGLNVFQGSAGRFYPKAMFSRAEVIAMVAVVTVGGNPQKLDLNTLFASDAARPPEFTDVDRSHWAYGAINYAYRMKIVEGAGGGRFNPSDVVTKDMVNSMLLGLLGVKSEDRSGPDWAERTAAFMNNHNIKLDADMTSYYPTREEVASALGAAVYSPVFIKSEITGAYIKQSNTLMQSAFGALEEDEEDKGEITITGKVVGTKYANLYGVNNYNRSVLLEGVGVNDGLQNGTVIRIETPEDDSVVPAALLGRIVTIKAVKAGEALYKAASGAKAIPLYTTDIVALPLNNDGTLNRTLYDDSCADIPASASINYAGISGNSTQFRGAYTNYGAGDGYSKAWEPKGSWSYAYAVTYGNTNYYSEVFYLNYRALTVHELYEDGTITFRALDRVSPAGVNNTRTNTFENGKTLAKDDIIVAVVDSGNNIITAEKVASKTGIKQGNMVGGGAVVSGESYDIWDNYVNYANRQMSGSWGGGIQTWVQNNSSMTFWAFRPVYGEFTRTAARIFHSSVPSENKEKWFEWEQPMQVVTAEEKFCILINATGGAGDPVVTIVAANGTDSGIYKLRNLYVREVKNSGILSGGTRMERTLAAQPIQLLGRSLVHASQGITGGEKNIIDTADGLFWTVGYQPYYYRGLEELSGINIYSYNVLPNDYIELIEWDAGAGSGVEIIKAAKGYYKDEADTLIVYEDGSFQNLLLFSQGRATANVSASTTWLSGENVSQEYKLNTSGAVLFTVGRGRSPLERSSWKVNSPNSPPYSYALIFTVGDDVKFIMYEEENP